MRFDCGGKLMIFLKGFGLMFSQHFGFNWCETTNGRLLLSFAAHFRISWENCWHQCTVWVCFIFMCVIFQHGLDSLDLSWSTLPIVSHKEFLKRWQGHLKGEKWSAKCFDCEFNGAWVRTKGKKTVMAAATVCALWMPNQIMQYQHV